MSTRHFLDTRVGTYSGLVMGPFIGLLGVYLVAQPVQFLAGTGIPHWLPGVLMLVYGALRTLRAVRGLRQPARGADAEADTDGPSLSRTAQAVQQGVDHARRAQQAPPPSE